VRQRGKTSKASASKSPRSCFGSGDIIRARRRGAGPHELAHAAEARASRAAYCARRASGGGAPGERACRRLEQAIRDAVPEWSLAELVTALQAMRGIDLIWRSDGAGPRSAICSRFQNPRELMGYLGSSLRKLHRRHGQPRGITMLAMVGPAYPGRSRLELSASSTC